MMYKYLYNRLTPVTLHLALSTLTNTLPHFWKFINNSAISMPGMCSLRDFRSCPEGHEPVLVKCFIYGSAVFSCHYFTPCELRYFLHMLRAEKISYDFDCEDKPNADGVRRATLRTPHANVTLKITM
jgi:hypothetical protein